VEEQRNYSDLFMLKTAKELIVIRLLQGAWFLFEIKKIVRTEANADRAVFMVHFGAAYMVWFSYYVLLLLVSLMVSEFYRIKLFFCVVTFANFFGCLLLGSYFLAVRFLSSVL